MKFVLTMAWREVRSSWQRLLFFFLCMGIGVGSIVALRSTTRNLNDALAGEARTLLTADVQIDSTRPWTPEALATIDRIARPPLVANAGADRTETIEAQTMARPTTENDAGAIMVELKGIAAPFPLFGDLTLADGKNFDYNLLDGNGAIVAPLLTERLNVRAGDKIKIGTADFEIRGILAHEPGGSGGFRLGPRVYVARDAIETAGLTGFGSRARRRILFRAAPGEMETLAADLRAGLKGATGVGVRSYKESQENLREQFDRAENYLSLTGLVILVLGGIGISNVTRVFIEQKKRTIAVLKCLGGRGAQIIAAYLLQVMTLGVAGSILGVALARFALWLVGIYFAATLPANMSYTLQSGAVVQGLAAGLLISILFSAIPLLRVRQIKPRILLRESDGITDGGASASGVARRFYDLTLWLTTIIVIIGLVLLASWQAGSIRVGTYFLIALAVTAGALYAAAMLLVRFLRGVRRVNYFPLRQAINSLYRPGNQTRVIVMAVGLGAFLVIAIQALEANLAREFDLERRQNVPNMFLIDVQKDQADGVADLVQHTTGERPQLIPTVRARFVAVNGASVEDDAPGQMQSSRGRLGREFVLTYRDHLESNERIVAGRFWDSSPTPAGAEAEVSVEEGLRGERGLDVGSRVTFDIQGRRMTALVTNLRHVDWRNSRTGFVVVFRPGALENAPQMYIGAINGPADETQRARFQRALLDRFPNISVIDVGEIVRTIVRILDNVTLAVSFLGAFVFLSGTLILIGSIAMTKFQRVYESAVLKTLGARRNTLLLMMLFEYALLGAVAGIIGGAASIGLSYAVAHYIFEIPWEPTPFIYLIGIIATTLLVMIVGALASSDVLARKPLAILRAE